MVAETSGLDSFTGFSSLMKPELATVFSAMIAVSSVGLNLYGGLLQEKSRVALQREVGWEAWVLISNHSFFGFSVLVGGRWGAARGRLSCLGGVG